MTRDFLFANRRYYWEVNGSHGNTDLYDGPTERKGHATHKTSGFILNLENLENRLF